MRGLDNTSTIHYLTTKKNLYERIVVKRRGNREPFDERKVYASVYAASSTANYPPKKREEIAHEISEAIKNAIDDKTEIKSSEIRKHVLQNLANFGQEKVALAYENYYYKSKSGIVSS